MPAGVCDSCHKKFNVPETGKKYRCKCGGVVMAVEGGAPSGPTPAGAKPQPAASIPAAVVPVAPAAALEEETAPKERPRRSRPAKPAGGRRASRRGDEPSEDDAEAEPETGGRKAAGRRRGQRSEARAQAEARKKKKTIIIAAAVVVAAIAVVIVLSMVIKAPDLEERVARFQEVWNTTGGVEDAEGLNLVAGFFLEPDKVTLIDKMKKRFILDKWIKDKPTLSNPKCTPNVDLASSDWWLSAGGAPLAGVDASEFKTVGITFEARFAGEAAVQPVNWVRDRNQSWRIQHMYNVPEFRDLAVVVQLFADTWNNAATAEDAIARLAHFGHSQDLDLLKSRIKGTFEKRGWMSDKPQISVPAVPDSAPESPYEVQFAVQGRAGAEPVKVQLRQSSEFWLLKEVE